MGDTVPIPKGFYYVGGDLTTGVIISDNQEDEYDGQTDKTTWEYTGNLKGNQFVWIPCKEEEYEKCEVWNGITQQPSGTDSTEGILSSGDGWDKATATSELPQIRKYEGFYVGRYEAGLASSIEEFTSTQQNNYSNQVYNKEGKPQSKEGIIPWMFIDWNHAQANSKNMYNTKSVSSGLITGTQWDVMLNKMIEKGAIQKSDLTNSENVGNYVNNSIEYIGRIAIGYKSGSLWYLQAFGGTETTSTTKNSNQLLTTGASGQTQTYHIFEVASNLREFTEEDSKWHSDSKHTNEQCYVARGGSFLYQSNYGMCYRHSGMGNKETSHDRGFRVVLYIK